MPTKFLVVETPAFQLGANAGANTERVDAAAFPARLKQHFDAAQAGSTDILFILAPSELRMQNAFADAVSGRASVSLAFFEKTQDAIRFLPSLIAFDGAERSGGVKEFLAKGSTIYTETFFNGKGAGTKLDPCFTFARGRLDVAASSNAWACLQSLVLLGLQSLPEHGEKGSGEKVDVQLGADEKFLALTVRFDLAPEKLPFLRANPILSVARVSASAFETRYVARGRKVELTCVFFRASAGGDRTVEITSYQATEATEGSDVKDYSFRSFGSLDGDAESGAFIGGSGVKAEPAATGGFKRKFSDRVKKVPAEAPAAEEPTTVKGTAAPAPEQKVVVSGKATLSPDKETIFKNEGAANRVIELESQVKSLEAALKTRDDLIAKANKDSADPMKKRDVLSGIKDNQNEGLKQTVWNLETELEEAREREKELMKMVDKAVQMKDEAAKKIKELDLKLKQASGNGGSKVQMLEKALEEQKRQNKELSKRINDLNEKMRAA